MGENITKDLLPVADASQTDAKQKIALEIAVPEHNDLVTCAVCGHQNTKDAGLCAMCSNYLFN